MAMLYRNFLVLFYFLMIVCYLTNVLYKASFLVPDNKQCWMSEETVSKA